MCIICGQTPCHFRCPNALPEVSGVCGKCGSEIEAGFIGYRDGEGNMFCGLECALEFYEIEETDL